MSKYSMSITLNVLDDLGKKLYSNVPAVISELVANSYDADANKVSIEIDKEKKIITITDNGEGMNVDDINDHYLNVGYKRRDKQPTTTPKYNREVMGRKGIGKLATFAIANNIKIYSIKDGEKNSFELSSEKIIAHLKENPKKDYEPDEIPFDESLFTEQAGTVIILTNLTKRLSATGSNLRTRLSRRFSIIGQEFNFEVYIDQNSISISDRNYFHKLRDVWNYDTEVTEDEFKEKCSDKLKNFEQRTNLIDEEENHRITGWIATVDSAGDLKDSEENLNKITIIARGRLVQENILDDFNEGGLYSKYLIGEIEAEFLDKNELEDLATSNRQSLISDDPRYEKLKDFIKNELIHIRQKWTSLRDGEGTERALIYPEIQEWFKELRPDSKVLAKKVFGKINRIAIDDDSVRKELFKQGIIAFENLRYKDNLEQIDLLKPEELAVLGKVLDSIDELESSMFYQIVKGRIAIIDKLKQIVDENELEKVVQEHLHEHLWLLDASWDRPTTPDVHMEETVKKAFDIVDKSLGEEILKSRVDLYYKKQAGKHVIIELKRANRTMSQHDLAAQVEKYITALRAKLAERQIKEPIEAICIVGKKLSQWTTPKLEESSKAALKEQDIRVVHYQELINNSYAAYNEFLLKRESNGRLTKLLNSFS